MVRAFVTKQREHLRSVRMLIAAGAHRDALLPQQVNRALAQMVSGGLAPSTTNRVRAILSSALNAAVRSGLLMRNVAALSEPGKAPKTRSPSIRYAGSLTARKMIDTAHFGMLPLLLGREKVSCWRCAGRMWNWSTASSISAIH